MSPASWRAGQRFSSRSFSGNELLEEAQLIVGVDDGVVLFQSDQLGMTAQHFGADRVECAEPRHPLHRLPDIGRATRSRISRAALLVKVTQRISDGQARRVATRCASRAVSAAVLPVPAPASIKTGPSVVRTACCCGGLSCAAYAGGSPCKGADGRSGWDMAGIMNN